MSRGANSGFAARYPSGAADTGWQSIGGTGPAYNTGWANFGAAFEVGQVRKTGTTIKVRGTVIRSSGASAVIFTLAAGMRPNRAFQRPAIINSAAGGLQINTDGTVNVITAYTNGQGCSFDFQFDTDEL